MTRTLLLTLAFFAALSPVALARACPRTTVADLEDEVMCPVCGTSLGLAREAPLAQRERALIARLADRCWTKQRIKSELVAEFGPAVLALPEDGGVDAAAYVAPVLAGAVLLAGALIVLGRWRRRAPVRAPPRLDGADRARLETELDRLR